MSPGSISEPLIVLQNRKAYLGVEVIRLRKRRSNPNNRFVYYSCTETQIVHSSANAFWKPMTNLNSYETSLRNPQPYRRVWIARMSSGAHAKSVIPTPWMVADRNLDEICTEGFLWSQSGRRKNLEVDHEAPDSIALALPGPPVTFPFPRVVCHPKNLYTRFGYLPFYPSSILQFWRAMSPLCTVRRINYGWSCYDKKI